MTNKSMTAYAIYTNTDLTEGRGAEYVMAVASSMTVAQRIAKGKYVQGCDCPIKECQLIYVLGKLYGPINLIEPTKEEKLAEEKRIEKEKVLEKVKKLGLTPEEIKIIKGG